MVVAACLEILLGYDVQHYSSSCEYCSEYCDCVFPFGSSGFSKAYHFRHETRTWSTPQCPKGAIGFDPAEVQGPELIRRIGSGPSTSVGSRSNEPEERDFSPIRALSAHLPEKLRLADFGRPVGGRIIDTLQPRPPAPRSKELVSAQCRLLAKLRARQGRSQRSTHPVGPTLSANPLAHWSEGPNQRCARRRDEPRSAQYRARANARSTRAPHPLGCGGMRPRTPPAPPVTARAARGAANWGRARRRKRSRGRCLRPAMRGCHWWKTCARPGRRGAVPRSTAALVEICATASSKAGGVKSRSTSPQASVCVCVKRRAVGETRMVGMGPASRGR